MLKCERSRLQMMNVTVRYSFLNFQSFILEENMIHPKTELRFVNDDIGYGVFATEFIPKGTILYVKDELEIKVSKTKIKNMDKTHKAIVEKFSYIDEKGVRILSWDHAKYINHKCDCNSMSTGYGFGIAIRDIARDEEITDEFGLFNIPEQVEINCQCNNCRKNFYRQILAKITSAGILQ